MLKIRRKEPWRIFREFSAAWKAFLNGVGPPVAFLWGALIMKRAEGTRLADVDPEAHAEKMITAACKLSAAGIQHGELRHPQYHTIVGKNVVFVDFDRSRITRAPKNLSKIVVWMIGRGVSRDRIKKVLENCLETYRGTSAEGDVLNALRAIRKTPPPRSQQR